MNLRNVIILMTVILIFHYCTLASEKKQLPKNKTASDTSFHLIKLFEYNAPASSSLYIVSDTIFVAKKSSFQSQKNFMFDKFFFDKEKKEIKMTSTSWQKKVKDLGFQDTTNANSKFFRTIRSLGIPYLKTLPQKTTVPEGFDISNSFLLEFNNSYFGINKLLPKQLIMIHADSSITKFNVDGFMEVTDFFLYDLNSDGYPEIFIFNIGKMSQQDAISYTVYSIKK